MGGSNSKNAGLTTISVEEYYNSIADNNTNESTQREERKTVTEPRGNFSVGTPSPVDYRLASEITRNLRIHANTNESATHLIIALRALRVQNYDAFNLALDALRKLDTSVSGAAKAVLALMKEYRLETAAIVIPLMLLVFTPVILGAAGFTAGGIAAGSIAAGIQAGIGNVAAGSIFALLTSAGMSGFGLPIVLGGVFATSSAALWSIATLRRWWRTKR